MTLDSRGHVCWVGGGKLESVEGVLQILFVGKGITNSAEERKTVAEGGFIHYI